MEIHTNIKFLFFSKAFLVPKQRLNKIKKNPNPNYSFPQLSWQPNKTHELYFKKKIIIKRRRDVLYLKKQMVEMLRCQRQGKRSYQWVRQCLRQIGGQRGGQRRQHEGREREKWEINEQKKRKKKECREKKKKKKGKKKCGK